jgi:hypothetical protein
MAKLILNGSTSGSITLESPAVSGTNTLTLPASTGTVVVTSGAQTIEFADGSASTPSITNSGDTNTGIFFSAADTIDFTEGGTACGQFDSSANFKFNSGYGSVATAYGCRAWVNFNGTGTVAIRASGNVSSITDNGTGDYTVNFTTAMPDANYVGVFGPVTRSGPDSNCMVRYGNAMGEYPLTTTTYRFGTGEITAGFTGQDAVAIQVAFFR